MENEYFVTFRNLHGQPSRTSFDSEAEFDVHYASAMEDGSGQLVSQAYPEILYQGLDEKASKDAWEKDFHAMISDTDRLESHLSAELTPFLDIDLSDLAVDTARACANNYRYQ